MEVLLPRTLQEALETKTAHPEAMPIAGGTDVIVGGQQQLMREGNG